MEPEVLDLGIDPESVTVIEQIELEEHAGITWSEMTRFMPVKDGGRGEPMPTRVLVAWLLLAARRGKYPSMTIGELQSMKMREFREFVMELKSGNADAGEEPAQRGQPISGGSRNSRTGSASRRRISGV